MTSLRWGVLGSMLAIPLAGLIAGVGCSSSGGIASPSNGSADASLDSTAVGDGAATAPDGDASQLLTLMLQVAATRALGLGAGDSGEPCYQCGATVGGGGGDGGDDGGDAGGEQGIPDVKVCVYQHSQIPCVMTGPDGNFLLSGLPAATKLVITFEKTGYVKTAKAIETANTPMQDSNAVHMVLAGEPSPALGVAIDLQTKGAASFFVLGPADGGSLNSFGAAPGAKVSLTPAAAPFFLKDDNTFDLSATSMVAPLGAFYNLAPGTYTLTVDDKNLDCAAIAFPFGEFGVPVPPYSVSFQILAGTWTDEVGFLCTQKSVLFDAGGGG